MENWLDYGILNAGIISIKTKLVLASWSPLKFLRVDTKVNILNILIND